MDDKRPDDKQLVLDFYRDVFNGWDLDKIDDYVAEDYIQHNPEVEDGREGFKKFMGFFCSMKPRCEVIRCDAAGGLVYVFFRCTLANGMVNKVMDVYRVDAGMLREHWDIVEHDVAAKERDAKNSNGIW